MIACTFTGYNRYKHTRSTGTNTRDHRWRRWRWEYPRTKESPTQESPTQRGFAVQMGGAQPGLALHLAGEQISRLHIAPDVP
jgi:hypothetical protein